LEIVNKNGQSVAIIDASEKIGSTQAALDFMASAQYLAGSGSIVVYKESLGEDFFDLKTGFAGDVLQKFSNYRVKLAIVGDFSVYKSKALRDFIYECNKGNLVFFKTSLEEALEALVAGR
jgi:hypothetical protein